MRYSGRFALLGDGSAQIARQAALLFAVSGLSALAAISTDPDRATVLAVIAVADLAIALVAWLLPWNRWHPRLPALLGLPGFAVLALSTWAFGGFAAGTGPFFVLLFAWLGLHQPRWVLAAYVPVATIAYLAPLVAAQVPSRVLASAIVLIPVSFAIGGLISAQAGHLRDELDRAWRAERLRTSLMATLAHDIRNPLTTVQGTLQVLTQMNGLPPDRRQTLLESALKQTKRLERLATSLLDVERVEQGKLQLDKRPTSVTSAISQAITLLGVDADIRVSVDPDLWANADPERLEQILINLTTNALRHGRPPVHITAHSDHHSVHIEVRDHGTGVPQHFRNHLFERLGGDSDHPDSVGLGMWIAQLLAEAHGGTVTYEDADPGARFCVRLPTR